MSHPATHGREPRTATDENAITGTAIDEKRIDEQEQRMLLRQVAEGDLGAWARLWGDVAPAVHRFIAHRLENRPSDPVTQDLACDVMDRLRTFAPTFEGKSKVLTWILGIAYNVVLEWFRDTQRFSGSAGESGGPMSNPEDQFPVPPDDLRALLDDLVSGLSAPRRRAITREMEFGSRDAAREGMTATEAATHRQNVSRARRDMVERIHADQKFVVLRPWFT